MKNLILATILALSIISIEADVIDFDAFPSGSFVGGGIEDGFTISNVINMSVDSDFLGFVSPSHSLHTSSPGFNQFQLDINVGTFQFVSLQAGGFFGGAEPMTLNGFLGGSFVASDTFSPPNGTYSQFNAFNLAGQTLDRIVFAMGNGGPGPTHIDDIVLQVGSTPDPVPEPSTVALLGIGLAALGYGRRKKA